MIGVLHLWLGAYGRAGIVLACAALIGYPGARRVVRGPTVAVVSALWGLCVLTVIVCLLAWVGLFYLWAVTAVAGVAAVPGVWRLVTQTRLVVRARRGGWRPRSAVLVALGIIFVALVAFSVLALYPPKNDASLYHLPLAEDLLRHHGLSYDPFVRFSFFPQANESLFAVVLMLGRDPYAPAALEFSVLAAGVIFVMLWFLQSGRWTAAGLVSALALLASPVVVFAGTSAFVDAWTMVFVLAGVLLALNAAEGRSPPQLSLGLAGACLGEAAATKYSGALFGTIALVAPAIAAGRSRTFWRAFPATVAGMAGVLAPWYAWTVHITGNPVYPFGAGLFGNRTGLWTPREIAHQLTAQRATPRGGIASIVTQDVRYLLGRSSYSTGAHRSPLSWWLPAGFLGLIQPSSRRNRTYLGVAVADAVAVITFLFLSADPRFILPALGPVALLCGLAVDGFLASSWGWFARRRSLVRMAPLAYLAAAVVLLWSSASYARSGPAVPTTATDVSSYLGSNVPCYPAVQYLNRHYGSRYTAWNQGCEKAHYYARGRLIGDAFSVASWYRVLNFAAGGKASLPDASTLARRLSGLSVGWVIVPETLATTGLASRSHETLRLDAQVGGMDILKLIGTK